MSGTSADGIDAALVKFKSAHDLKVRATCFIPYPDSLQQRINHLAHGNTAQPKQPEYVALDYELAEHYSKAAIQLIAASGIAPEKVVALANHGQTVAHRPGDTPPESLQVGDPQRLANLSGLPVISRFRQADMLVGGQGAPLMPAFHKALSESKNLRSGQEGESLLVVNLGGIANVTLLGKHARQAVIGFDTGPANTLLNQWVYKHKNVSFDEGGRWAASGEVQREILNSWLDDPYFKLPHPKSTGPDYFNLAWAERLAKRPLSEFAAQDIQATFAELTAVSLQAAIASLEVKSGTLLVCGGGVHNDHLMARMRELLNPIEVKSSIELGVPPDWMEAAGFAWLGYCNLNGIPSNLPSVTAASKAVVLGELFAPER